MSPPEKWLAPALTAAAAPADVWPVLAPQNPSFPLVVYRRTGTNRERGLGGNFGVPIATFSISIVSQTYLQAKDIADAIRMSLDNFTGDANGATIVTTALTSESDNMERPPEGQSKPLYRVDQTYSVRFRETV
jgi:hypothetical protein